MRPRTWMEQTRTKGRCVSSQCQQTELLCRWAAIMDSKTGCSGEAGAHSSVFKARILMGCDYARKSKSPSSFPVVGGEGVVSVERSSPLGDAAEYSVQKLPHSTVWWKSLAWMYLLVYSTTLSTAKNDTVWWSVHNEMYWMRKKRPLPIWGIILELAWNWGKPRNTYVKTTGIPVEIWTSHLPNT